MVTDPNAYYAGGRGVELYDLFTGAGLLAGDIEFYLECARRFGGPILELGTGTGRVLVPLADAGHEVVGMDLSSAKSVCATARFECPLYQSRTAKTRASDRSPQHREQRGPKAD